MARLAGRAPRTLARAARSASLLLLGAGACAPAPRPAVPRASGTPAVAATAARPNLVVAVREAVEGPEADAISMLKVFVGGEFAGETPPGPRSQEKRWEGEVPAGNHPIRFELWLLKGLGDWTRLPEDLQPRERFLRFEPGRRARVSLRFYDRNHRHDYEVIREPL